MYFLKSIWWINACACIHSRMCNYMYALSCIRRILHLLPPSLTIDRTVEIISDHAPSCTTSDTHICTHIRLYNVFILCSCGERVARGLQVHYLWAEENGWLAGMTCVQNCRTKPQSTRISIQLQYFKTDCMHMCTLCSFLYVGTELVLVVSTSILLNHGLHTPFIFVVINYNYYHEIYLHLVYENGTMQKIKTIKCWMYNLQTDIHMCTENTKGVKNAHT